MVVEIVGNEQGGVIMTLRGFVWPVCAIAHLDARKIAPRTFQLVAQPFY